MPLVMGATKFLPELLHALRHAREDPRGQHIGLRRASCLLQVAFAKLVPILKKLLKVLVGATHRQFILDLPAEELCGEALALPCRGAHVFDFDVVLQLLDAARKLRTVLAKLRVVRLKPRRQENLQGLAFRRLVELPQLVLTHWQVLHGRVVHPSSVDLHGIFQAQAQLVLHNRSPSGLDGRNGAVVHSLAILGRQVHKHGARDKCTLDLLGLQGHVHLANEGLDLCAELWPQRLIRQPLDISQVALFGHRPHDRHAIPFLEEVLDHLTELVFLVLTWQGLQRILQILPFCNRRPLAVGKPEMKVAQHPEQVWEVLRQLRGALRLLPLLGLYMNVLRQVKDQVQIVDGLLVDRPHRVVDEVRRQQNAQGEYLHVATRSALRGAQTLGVDEDTVVIGGKLHRLTPYPQTLRARVDGRSDFEALL
mmetsp:Transcript_77751/g.251869  ORF Transcript_77751/g.251869 Transcript_77751/m.251869 type:complete len:423 (-) Transcript_77751:282-1550(-)